MKHSIIFLSMFLFASTANSFILSIFMPSSVKHKSLLLSEREEWSEPFVIYRAYAHEPSEHVNLDNLNLGNYDAELKYLNRKNAAESYHYIKAFKIKVNYFKASEYYHCEQGLCEFRFTYGESLVREPVQKAAEKFHVDSFERFGIKENTASFQISKGKTNVVDFFDVYMEPEDAKDKIYRCSSVDGVDCFFAFATGSNGHSYEILDETVAIPFDSGMNVKDTLDSLYNDLMK